jgi:hypothetical protein
VWRGCNNKLIVCLPLKAAIHDSLFKGGMIFMGVYKHWLDYDAAALAFLIVGIAAVGLIAIII